MKEQVFDQFKSIIERESGIHLSDQKKALLENRIQKRLRALQVGTEEEYLKIIELDVAGEELINLIDVVSTNVTYFWREPQHFEFYRKLLERYRAEGCRRLRVWCAASSSGEEPYTLAMIARETLGVETIDFKVLATDICTPVLQRALKGFYPVKQLEKMPDDLTRKYFKRSGDGYQISDELQRMVTFKKLNMAHFPYPLKGPLDVIFCRNVMIYFDRPLRQKIVLEFERLLEPGGHLFVSHSENLLGIEHRFETQVVAAYKLQRRRAG